MLKLWNIRQKHSNILMLGYSVYTEEEAKQIMAKYYNNETTMELNKRRWEYSQSPPLPLDNYEVIQTDTYRTF